jgi:16S rRNA processing protein RimM
MDADAFVEIGRVAKTHGLAGEVSVITTVDLPASRLVGLQVWFVPPPAQLRSSRITAVRSGPKGPLFAFEGVSDIGSASMLRGLTVLAKSVELPDVEEEFDAVGYSVTDEKRGDLGEVVDTIVTGANDVWVVEGPFGQVLIPVIDDVIVDIDDDEEHIRVRLLPGLIDEG